MENINLWVILPLLVSIGFNLFLIYHYKIVQKKEPEKTYDANAILHDLTAHGHSIVKVVRLNPEDFFLRSPRDK